MGAISFQKMRGRILVSKKLDHDVERLRQEVFVGDGNRHGTLLSKYLLLEPSLEEFEMEKSYRSLQLFSKQSSMLYLFLYHK